MRPRLLRTRVLAVLLLVGCADAAAPNLFGPMRPEFAVVPSVNPNGQFNAAGDTIIIKGFNPVNPHNGDAIIATFFWSGPATITRVWDHETNRRLVGNTYNLVESVSAGDIHMATYVAFNVGNFPDAFDERSQMGDSILVVHASMSGPVTAGGMMITAWSGVQPTVSQGLGGHSSGSGSSTTQTIADPGTIGVNPGALVYAVTMGNQVVGMDPPPPPFSNLSNQSDPANTIKGDAERMVQGGSSGSTHPTWVWGFNSGTPRTWLATVLALNERPTSSTGNLTVSASTTGSNLDADGYTVTVDGGSAQAIGINGSVTFNGLAAGSHSVALSGVAGNCTVSGGNTQTVNVPSGGTANTTFSVSCSATTGTLTVSTSTTGSNLDPDGYTVTVDGGSAQAIGINGSVSYTNLSAGNHTVAISGVAGNCSVSGGNTQTVNVPSGGTANTTFSVSCSATTGTLTVSTSTTGSNLDPDGYTVTVDGGASQAVATNGNVTFTGLAAGNHSVVLSGVAGNCTVSGGNTQTVNVPAGGTGSTTFTVSCSATTGNLTVSTSTTGSNLDPNGYTVTVDGGSPQAIAINGSVTFNGLAAGNHSVALSGVAANCTVSGGNTQTVNVPAGGTASATFSVSCTATTGNLTVSTSTTGSSLDPDGYTVTVDGGSPQAIGINGSVSYTNLSAGNHTVAISGVAANCSVSGGTSRTVNVPSGGTASTTFSVSCSTPSGNLTVSTSTTGSSLDPDGYTVTVDGGSPQAIGINASVSYTNLSAGNHTVAISGVAGNCSVSGGTSRTVNVPSGGTASTTFSVSCTTPSGNLTVSTSTTGSTLDPDGYTVTVDGGSPQAIGINSSVSYTNLSAGNHTVAISGVAGNCSVSGGTSRTVNVPSGGTGSTTFSVSCTTPSGNLTVSTSTTGSSLDPDGYTVTVDGGSPQAIGINSSVSYTNLSAGNHTVAISGVAGNCSVSGGTSRTVNVPSGGTGSTTFSVSCTTPSGNLTVSTSTTGSSLDPDGYTVAVDGAPQAIGINGSVTFTGLSAGSHSVVLTGVASNCTVSGGTTRTATVPAGGTATVSYAVSCTAPNRPPVVNAGPDQVVLLSLLGVTYTLNASFSDPDNDGPWSYTINWGDGATSTGTTASQGTISASHHYANILSTRTVTVTVRDAHGASGADSKTVTLIL